HRPLGPTTSGRRDFGAWLRALTDLTPDARFLIVAVLRASSAGFVYVLQLSGTNQAGQAFTSNDVFLSSVSDGRITGIEAYPADEAETAIARLEELAPSSTCPPWLDTGFVREAMRFWRWVLAHDWEGVRALTAEDAVIDDRRSLVSSRAEGRDAAVAWLQSVVDIGVTDVGLHTIASRGGRLLLNRMLFRGGGGEGRDAEGESLVVVEYSDDGLWLAAIVFDPDDLEAAFAELDARYLTGEGAPYAAAWQVTERIRVAYNARDWAALEAAYAEDLIVEDHRPAAWGRLDRAGLMATFRGLMDLAPDAQMRVVAFPRVHESGGAAVVSVNGTDANGGAFEIPEILVARIQDSRVTSLDVYGPDDLTAALARADELRRQPTPSYLDNQAARTHARNWRRIIAGDWALDTVLSERTVIDDRRAVVGSTAQGREAVGAWLRSLHDIGITAIEHHPLATRGERLVLNREVYRGAGGEVEALAVIEFGEGGEVLRAGVIFDAEDLEAAVSELEARFAAGEAASYAEGLASLIDGIGAINARDWDRAREYYDEDFVFVDHRVSGAGAIGREEFVDFWRAMVELAPDARWDILAVPRISQSGLVYTVRISGTDTHGADFEVIGSGAVLRAHGRCTRIEYFADQEEAIGRFDELVPAALATRDLDNDAARRMVSIFEDFEARDWERFASQIAEGAEVEDRRPIVGGLRYEGRNGVVGLWRSIAAVGVTDVVSTTVATRGDRLVLASRLFRGAVGETESLGIAEFDAGGSYLGGAVFEPQDLEVALAELDARFTAGEAAPSLDMWRSATEVLDAINARDWERAKAQFADDLAYADHRIEGGGPGGRQT
ncbi:MAG: nuclear transport factor 2 family protein, partial [Acidimicrobiia bacterium]|nr:nuclear transport factor 2 family protein [Acidimicrobiia bacterium]